MASKTVRVYEVLVDTKEEGPACDGTKIARFRSESEARKFATTHTCYGKPASVSAVDPPRRIAERWGMC